MKEIYLRLIDSISSYKEYIEDASLIILPPFYVHQFNHDTVRLKNLFDKQDVLRDAKLDFQEYSGIRDAIIKKLITIPAYEENYLLIKDKLFKRKVVTIQVLNRIFGLERAVNG